jgi:hypothetical protein
VKIAKVLLGVSVISTVSVLLSLPAHAGFLDVIQGATKVLDAYNKANGNSSSSSSSSDSGQVLEQQPTTFNSSCQYPIKIAGYQIKNGSKQMVGWYTIQPYSNIVIDLIHKGDGVVAYYGEIATPNIFPNVFNGNNYRKTIDFNGKMVQPVLEQSSDIYLQCDNSRVQPTQVDAGQKSDAQPQYLPQPQNQQQAPAPAPIQQQVPTAPPSLIQTYN